MLLYCTVESNIGTRTSSPPGTSSIACRKDCVLAVSCEYSSARFIRMRPYLSVSDVRYSISDVVLV